MQAVNIHFFYLVSTSCSACTAELRLREEEIVQRASQVCCSAISMLPGGKRMIERRAHQCAASYSLSSHRLWEGMGDADPVQSLKARIFGEI